MLQAAALCRSGSDKVKSSQDSVKSYIKIIYPEDILISDARLEKNTEICEIKLLGERSEPHTGVFNRNFA